MNHLIIRVWSVQESSKSSFSVATASSLKRWASDRHEISPWTRWPASRPLAGLSSRLSFENLFFPPRNIYGPNCPGSSLRCHFSFFFTWLAWAASIMHVLFVARPHVYVWLLFGHRLPRRTRHCTCIHGHACILQGTKNTAQLMYVHTYILSCRLTIELV